MQQVDEGVLIILHRVLVMQGVSTRGSWRACPAAASMVSFLFEYLSDLYSPFPSPFPIMHQRFTIRLIAIRLSAVFILELRISRADLVGMGVGRKGLKTSLSLVYDAFHWTAVGGHVEILLIDLPGPGPFKPMMMKTMVCDGTTTSGGSNTVGGTHSDTFHTTWPLDEGGVSHVTSISFSSSEAFIIPEHR
ncbi:hypothetical protein JZ751_027369 [Albula glossodonta]|uniref:Uncharacterized protein n=1 Tax=Albula glossodonta TaxID=121402 RepID=A0A8T2MPL7_9TELE|nr:hypothetical protein JZ751_027369 [Albula glossodonta]